jgi:hypothetical protein
MADVRKRPRKLKCPQGLPSIALHVRIPLPAYRYIETEMLRRSLSKARIVSEILLAHMLEHRQIPLRHPPGSPRLPFDEKSGTTD